MQPKIGHITMTRAMQDGRPVLVLQNAMGLARTAIALPEALSLLPALCDGTRDVSALRASLAVRAGVQLPMETLAGIIEQMDQALLFENGRQAQAMEQALADYRSADGRPPLLAGKSYAADGEDLRRALDELAAGAAEAPPADEPPAPAAAVRAVVSPHIDFARGGSTYAGVWTRARPALESAELVVVLGTDHRGGPGTISPTRQHYRTPWGRLETDLEAADTLATALGVEAAFGYELHHAFEHSIELAMIWLHYVEPSPGFRLLPILCGSFEAYLAGKAVLDQDSGAEVAARTLAEMARRRRTVIVAAVDLAHIGPAFGGRAVGPLELAACRAADQALMGAVCRGDAAGFLEQIQSEADRRNVCGIPPLYVMLRALGEAQGYVTGYDECPADAQRSSWVTIAGALLW